MTRKLRFVLWPVIIIAAVVAGVYFYMQGVEQQVWWNVRKLGHRNADISYQAWMNLNDLYYTKWAAYDPILEAIGDTRPLNLLIERGDLPTANPAVTRQGFHAARKPIFFKTERVYCYTVGDAIAAIAYNETTKSGKPKWRTDFAGDWRAWWTANKGYYGVLE